MCFFAPIIFVSQVLYNNIDYICRTHPLSFMLRLLVMDITLKSSTKPLPPFLLDFNAVRELKIIRKMTIVDLLNSNTFASMK